MRLEAEHSIIVKEMQDRSDAYEREYATKMEEIKQKETQVEKKHKDISEVLTEEKPKLVDLVKQSEELRAKHAMEEDAAVQECRKIADSYSKHQKWLEDQIDGLNEALRGNIKSVTEAVVDF